MNIPFCVLSLLLIVLQNPLHAAEFSLGQARVHGAIGETGHLFLVPQGLHARPLYNDIFGHTDKHLSGETQLGYVGQGGSWELVGSWRFLTPCFREDLSKAPLDSPVGRYADWLEIQAAWARVYKLATYDLRLQAGLGLGDISDKGARSVHRLIHAKVGSSLEGLDYLNQPQGKGIGRNVELGLIQSWQSGAIQTLWNVGYAQNLMVEEVYAGLNALASLSERSALAVEGQLVRHLSSRAYGHALRDQRWEWALGWRHGAWRPSLKYVAPFLKGDAIGQIYFDPLAFVIEF